MLQGLLFYTKIGPSVNIIYSIHDQRLVDIIIIFLVGVGID